MLFLYLCVYENVNKLTIRQFVLLFSDFIFAPFQEFIGALKGITIIYVIDPAKLSKRKVL